MATAADIKARRAKAKAQESHVIAPTVEEKTAAIDSLFSKFAPAGMPKPQAIPQVEESSSPQSGGVEIFSAMGFGSILVNGKDTSLPYIVRDPLTLLQLKATYVMDTPNSVLRTRKVQ